MLRPRPFVIAVALAVALGACSQAAPSGGQSGGTAGGSATSGTGGAGAGGKDACSLLTADEIKVATGLAVTGNGEPALKNGKECKWQLEPGKNVEGVAFERFVDISLFGRAYYQGATAISPGPETVSGVGDQAVYVSDVLVALKGDQSFALTVNLHETGNGTPEISTKEHDAALSLGKLAAPRF